MNSQQSFAREIIAIRSNAPEIDFFHSSCPHDALETKL